VKSLNQFALIEKTTFSQVNLDFVLSTDSYSGENELSSLSPALCIPCRPLSSHVPSSSVSSFGMEFSQPFALSELKKVLDDLLFSNGNTDKVCTTIYRMKGFIHISEENNLYLLQAVYNTFELIPSQYPVDRVSQLSKMVIIGCNLDPSLLNSRFTSALVST
jgi:G3E family GTPase